MEKISKERMLTDGNVTGTLLRFAVPFLLALLLQTLYGAVDMMIVGQFGTTADQSGVAIGSQIMSLISYMLVGFTTGITVLLGRALGEQDEKKLQKILGNSILLFAAVAVILTAILLLFQDALVAVMQTPAEAVTNTRQYLFFCGIGIVFIVGYNVVRGIMMGLGDSKTPLLCVMIACIMNIGLDLIFVKFLGMGAAGAALATCISQAMGFLFSLAHLMRKGVGFAFAPAQICFDRRQFLSVLKMGGPLAVQNTLIMVSFLAITVITNSMGVVTSASVGVVEKAIEFLIMPSSALGTAISAMVAQNYGAGEHERAKQCLFAGMKVSLIIAVLICGYCYFWSDSITGLFSKDPEVIALAAEYLQPYSLDCLVLVVTYSFNGYFIGYGKSSFTMIHNIISSIFVRIPMVYILCMKLGASLFVLGFVPPVSTCVSAAACLIYWKIFRIPGESAAGEEGSYKKGR